MYDNDAIMAAIWAAPEKCTGLRFEWRGGAWVSMQDPDGTDHPKSGGRTIIRRNASTGVIYVNCNGDGYVPAQGIIKHLKWLWGTNDTYDVYKRLGEIYDISPDLSGYTDQQRERYETRRRRQPIYDAVAEYLTAVLNTSKGAATRDYLASRGLQPTARLGAVSEDVIKDLKAALTRKYPQLSYKQASAEVEAIFTIGEKDYRINTNDYGLIGPYYNGSGHVAGFWLRLTNPAASTYTDANGTERKRPKYLYSDGLIKNGYCLNLRADKPAIIVEGILDAERLRQAAEAEAAQPKSDSATDYSPIDLSNVMAIGGAIPNDDTHDAGRSQLQTLQRYGIKKLICVPDYEFDDNGKQKTAATENTIKAILPHLNGKLDGDGFVSLKIAQLYNQDPASTDKQDADSFINEFGASRFKAVLADAVDYYDYQLQTAAKNLRGEDLQAAALRIYLGIVSPLDKEHLKGRITKATNGHLAQLRELGVNAAALTAVDRNGLTSTYREELIAGADALSKAIEGNATAEQIGVILRRLAKTQAHRADGLTAHSFEAQANATAEQIERQIAAQPDYIETSWQLYSPIEDPTSKVITNGTPTRKISFAPAAISIIAAPTNYGKTAFMMQAAVQLAAQGNKRYVYLSTEEDQRQLYLRACATYIGDKWPAGSHPRKDLRQLIRDTDLPDGNIKFTDGSLPFNLEREKAEYNRVIAPRLKLIYSNEDVTTFCTKIIAQVEEWRDAGIDVGGVFIDYMQMIRSAGRSYNRADEVQVICAELNGLAKTTGLPLIIGSQMNRAATQSGTNGVGFDGVGLENLSDGSGIEKIAQDAYLLWNTSKEIKRGANDDLHDASGQLKPLHKLGYRTRRIIGNDGYIRPNVLYVENLKARDYDTGSYGLLDYDGAAGYIAPLAQYK